MSDCHHEWYETATLGAACIKCGEEHQDVETLLNTKEERISELEQALHEIRTEAVNNGSFQWIADKTAEVLTAIGEQE